MKLVKCLDHERDLHANESIISLRFDVKHKTNFSFALFEIFFVPMLCKHFKECAQSVFSSSRGLAQMGSEKLHDLMGYSAKVTRPKVPHQISKTANWIGKILTALERALQDAPDTTLLT